MTIAKKIPADHGLTTRMFMTGLFLVILYSAFAAILFALFKSLVVMIVLMGGFLFAQYWFSDKIALWGMRGKIVSPEEQPALHGAIDRLCALADMPKPKVAIADTPIPNAFATGRNAHNSVVCVTTGLLRRLDGPEIEAVLAHELSHVAHRDVAVMTIASSLGVLAGLLTRMMMWSAMFGGMGGGFGGGRSRTNQGAGQIVALELAVMLVSMVVYAISFLLTRALSRYRELAADRSGAILIQRPALLASALEKISGEMSRIPTQDLRHAEPFNAFFFSPALTTGPNSRSSMWAQLFSTHPSLEKRLAQLSELEKEIGRNSGEAGISGSL
jgi:heat shock protein HtpX